MGDLAQKARLSFLDQAAHTYAVSAPSTAAYLMMQYRTVAAGSGSGGPLLRPKNTCGACGSIMVPGQTCRTRLDDHKVRREGSLRRKNKSHKPSKPPLSSAEKTLNSQCLLCWRSTGKPLQGSKISTIAKAEPFVPLAEPSRITPSMTGERSMPRNPNNDSPRPTAANANSKKRAKARKESGLGALLAKAKSSQTPSLGLGLDLLDMMAEI